MKSFWTFIFLLSCFCVTGKIDYEAEVAMEEFRKECAQNFHNCRAAAMAAKEAK